MIIRRAQTADCDALYRLYVVFHKFDVRNLPNRLSRIGAQAGLDCGDRARRIVERLARLDAAVFVAEPKGGWSDSPRSPCARTSRAAQRSRIATAISSV